MNEELFYKKLTESLNIDFYVRILRFELFDDCLALERQRIFCFWLNKNNTVLGKDNVTERNEFLEVSLIDSADLVLICITKKILILIVLRLEKLPALSTNTFHPSSSIWQLFNHIDSTRLQSWITKTSILTLTPSWSVLDENYWVGILFM